MVTCIIFCGGRGMRLKELTENTPKPLIKIGSYSIVEHIMDQYIEHFDDINFILLTGYKHESFVKEFDDRPGVTVFNTGLDTKTGHRLAMALEELDTEISDTFFLTYGDGLSDINLNDLLKFHDAYKHRLFTLTAVPFKSKYGLIVESEGGHYSFDEKPRIPNRYINGGYMVTTKEIINYIPVKDTMLVENTIPTLFELGKVNVFHLKNDNYWKCIDTYKDYEEMVQLYEDDKL